MPTYPEAVISDAANYANVAGRASVPLQDKAYLLQPRLYPLVSTTILAAQFGKMDSYGGPKPPAPKKRPVDNTVYEVWFSRGPECRVTVNNAGGYSATAVSITVDDASKVRLGSILVYLSNGVPTERMIVTARSTSTNVLTVIRAIDVDSVNGQVIEDDAVLLIAGNANTDGAAVGTDNTYDPTHDHNATQIFRAELSVGGSAEAERQQTGSPMAFNRILKAQELCQKLEIAMLLGKTVPTLYYTTDVSGDRCYVTNGMDAYINTNRVDAAGALDEDELDAFLDQISEKATFDEDPCWCYTGSNLMRIINRLAKDKRSIIDFPKEYGSRVAVYRHANGDVNFVREPFFSEANGMAGTSYFLRPSKIEINPKKGREMRIYPNVKSLDKTGDDKMVDAYLAEMGFYLGFEETSGVLYGITV